MTLLALLITTDDSASEILGRVLPASGMAVERFSHLPAAIERLRQHRFDALILDYEDPQAASEILEEGRRLNSGKTPVTVALVAERARARDILSGGAHFILYKPLSDEKTKAGLRAVTALLNRERRRAHRVPVQAPVELSLPDTRSAEGILLDLSETGMDVLTAEPQYPSALLQIRFQLPDGSLEVRTHGQVAWAKPNGQTGVVFLDMDEDIKVKLRDWLAAAAAKEQGSDEVVPHCKLTDLSLGGCYLETDSPFPEHALIDLCFQAGEMELHTEGMVRVTHPGYGMGVEFPSRTPEQRAQVIELINFLRECPQSMLQMTVSPRALTADLTQFEPVPPAGDESTDVEGMEDPLLELLRQATTMQQEDFLRELRRQRSGESVTA